MDKLDRSDKLDMFDKSDKLDNLDNLDNFNNLDMSVETIINIKITHQRNKRYKQIPKFAVDSSRIFQDKNDEIFYNGH